MDTWYNVAKEAYRAYAAVTDNKNFRGDEMPKFSELPEEIQNAWEAACQKSIDYAVEIGLNGITRPNR